ncbi:tonB-system energizer ExbB [Rhizobium sp. SL42]|uniref:tonB-system energizer ExbB n=1 Tax=Rhizobium sp. SL42 TaxID=2806346 RepID=UPI001F025983|nr:tonB-system energizer ExbB [Rhizobium sp. SL42]UJW74982.1 tonB-system energizer ExbB [Rhizobium sp. SL42]
MPLTHSGPSIRMMGLAALVGLAVNTVVLAQENSTPAIAPAASVVQNSPVVPNVPAAAQSVAPAAAAPSTDAASPVQAPAASEPAASVPPADVPAQAPASAATASPAVGTPGAEPAVNAQAPAPASGEPAASASPAPAPSAETAPVDAVAPSDASAAAILPHDLSPYGMFMAADWVVKAVMLSLAFASLVTWTVWVAKTLQLFGARQRANRGLKAVVTARSLQDALTVLERRGGVVASMVRAAKHEMSLSDAAIDHAGGAGVKERVSSALGRIEARAGRQMAKGTGVLASIGSTAPFVGLFGTVWGIMNSFIGIAETQTTNLAVVAPGIAEALLATAVGLVAAIPAVIIYNVFARSVTGYRQLLSDASAGIERLISRDLDFRKTALRGGRAETVTLAAE